MKTPEQVLQNIENDGLAVLYRSLKIDSKEFVIELNTPANINKYEIIQRLKRSSKFIIISYSTENILDDSDLSEESGNLFVTLLVKFPCLNFEKVKQKFTKEFNIHFDPTEDEYIGTKNNMKRIIHYEFSIVDKLKSGFLNLLPSF